MHALAENNVRNWCAVVSQIRRSLQGRAGIGTVHEHAEPLIVRKNSVTPLHDVYRVSVTSTSNFTIERLKAQNKTKKQKKTETCRQTEKSHERSLRNFTSIGDRQKRWESTKARVITREHSTQQGELLFNVYACRPL